MLKIIKESDPITVTQLTICLYAIPGVGKTTTAFTAEAPLLFDFDKGSYRARNRKDVVGIDTWADISAVTVEDLKPYKTIVIDTAGRALDMLSQDIIAKNPKLGYNGALSLQGFGQLKAQFTSWLKFLRAQGKDVILIAHSDEKQQGDAVIERLDIQGASKNEIYKSADAMGRITLVNGVRTLNFSPSDVGFGKNPAQLPVLQIPEVDVQPQFFAGVIKDIKDKLNQQTEAQKATVQKMDGWREKFTSFKTLDEFNGAIQEAANSDPAVRSNVGRLLTAEARKHGFELDKTKGVYVVSQKKGTKAAA